LLELMGWVRFPVEHAGPDILHIGSGCVNRTAAGRVLALGAPVGTGGNVARGGRRWRNVGETGATG